MAKGKDTTILLNYDPEDALAFLDLLAKKVEADPQHEEEHRIETLKIISDIKTMCNVVVEAIRRDEQRRANPAPPAIFPLPIKKGGLKN